MRAGTLRSYNHILVSGEIGLWQGRPVSPGHAGGRVIVVRTQGDARKVDAGDIVVLRTLSTGLVVASARAAGFVAERGGPLSNGATLARERGIPVVVLEGATSILRTGDQVTLDGTLGKVRRGGSYGM